MPRHLILAQSRQTLSALGAWLELLGERPLEPGGDPRGIVWDERRRAAKLIDGFAELTCAIETAIAAQAASSGDRCVVMVDAIDPDALSAIGEGGWNTLVAMLILTFPDVEWLFGVIERSSRREHRPPEGICRPLTTLLRRAQREPLFDPTGLRDWVRSRTNEALRELEKNSRGRPLELPTRSDAAAIIEDEQDTAMLHAYTAYRYGFRAEVVSWWSLMQARFHDSGGPAAGKSHGYRLIMEDMRLNFADKPANVHLSYLDADPSRRKDGSKPPPGRAHHCNLLDNARDTSNWRFLITTGQMAKGGEEVDANREYLGRRRSVKGAQGGRASVVAKPLGGVCKAWEKLGFFERSTNPEDRPGNAPEFVWPPRLSAEASGTGHGAPGKLSLISEALLRRSHSLKNAALGPADYLRAAVLATDAAELLGARTPTATLAAVAAKHECETLAECGFISVGVGFGLGRRLQEIELEAEAVCRWFHDEDPRFRPEDPRSRHDQRERTTWDARASIVNRLATVFGDSGKREEEETCLIVLRGLNRRLRRPARKINLPGWIFHGILAYAERLLYSFRAIVLAATLWLLGFAAVHYSMDANPSIVQSITTAATWFLGASPGDPSPLSNGYPPIAVSPPRAPSPAAGVAAGTPSQPASSPSLPAPPFRRSIHVLSWVAVAVGLFHIGLLISHLYSLVSRR
jgi:hypothetical protein